MFPGVMSPRSSKYSEFEVITMKNKLVLRGLLGFPLGVFIGYAISIGTSLFHGDGLYAPCVPALIQDFGSELNAVIFQAVLSGLLGASFAAASTIWENDKWSIAKQTGIYFLVISLTMLPIAYFTHWMERTFLGFLSYFGIFVIVFVVVWVIQYAIWKNKLQNINKKINLKE